MLNNVLYIVINIFENNLCRNNKFTVLNKLKYNMKERISEMTLI